MTEQQLLARIGANTDDGSKITTDYNPAIVNTSGDYLVHLYAVDAAGNQATPVEITIHVKDTTAPIITADKKISYPVGTDKTVTEFLQDIHATTDDGSKITTDFDPNMLKTKGTYTIHLNAVDADGNKAKTIDVSLTVEEKVTPPTPPTPDDGGNNTNNGSNGTNDRNANITVNPTKQNTTATNESIPALGDTTSTIPVIVGMFLLATSLVLIRRNKKLATNMSLAF